MLCALIMAGGKGTRFWPLSTEKKPKQFLNLLGDSTMIQMTVKRIEKLIPIERVFVVTGKQYVDLVKEQLPNIPHDNIIIEPYGKNTAPCIVLSAFCINKKYSNATIVVLPSDHLIEDNEEFLNVLKAGEEYVEDNHEAIVTIGIMPNRPETEYGYINFDRISGIKNGRKILSVNRFVEKPNEKMAKKYLDDGHYLWNGGMFIWKTYNILSLTKKYLSKTFDVISEIATTSEREYDKVLEEKYEYVDGVSVDYGIMEKAEEIYVIPGEFGWDDVGSWSAIERYWKKDRDGSVVIGNGCCLEGKNNMIVCNGNRVIIDSLSDIFIVENDGYIIVGKKENVDRIKKVKEKVAI
ncbi:alginate biosynthesis protein AlgA [Clostridium tepidiprofundi DSM 19306]|uniref:mannose-1-phosphate guanylyltransferase n=1 Tax=Clostridium tepidiprofundi DSM 19306 TaxID=1121338 RepID=A0A151AUY7_9CLOT|nr:mannose-1-phosphate guanylyltransferase [Clostridium tepidiprofundi]KYH31217.1 alginate biosynthesis protein AlgA [Clostridium tepidiprofundi DSM 19306]